MERLSVVHQDAALSSMCLVLGWRAMRSGLRYDRCVVVIISGTKLKLDAQSKNARRDPATIVDFRGETGVMKALIRCKAHPSSPRPTFEICTLNTNGEVSTWHHS